MEEDDQILRRAEESERHDSLVRSFLRPRLENAERIYAHAINSLWIGNGGATVATLSFAAATARQGLFNRWLLVPLACFVIGLISMGFGSFFALIKESSVINRIYRTDDFLDLPLDAIQTPNELVGLTLRDPRTLSALISVIMFIFGCVSGLAVMIWLL